MFTWLPGWRLLFEPHVLSFVVPWRSLLLEPIVCPWYSLHLDVHHMRWKTCQVGTATGWVIIQQVLRERKFKNHEKVNFLLKIQTYHFIDKISSRSFKFMFDGRIVLKWHWVSFRFKYIKADLIVESTVLNQRFCYSHTFVFLWKQFGRRDVS